MAKQTSPLPAPDGPAYRWRLNNGSCMPWKPLRAGFNQIPTDAVGLEFHVEQAAGQAEPERRPLRFVKAD